MKRRLTALAVCLLLLLAGCGQQVESAAQVTAEAVPATYAMVLKEQSNPYMHKMFEGFSSACGELGAEAVVAGPDDYTAEGQVALIEELIEAGVDGIAVAANHTDALEEVLNRAMDAGIPVISLDSSVNPDSRMLHIQQADPERIGRVLVQAAWSMVGEEGQAVIISSTPYASNQSLWVEWMVTELEENPDKYSSFEVLEICYGYDSPEETTALTEALLDRYPDLDIIISPSAVSMQAIGRVLRDRESDVLFTGLGLPSEIADDILEERCPWMYLWNPIDMGYLAGHVIHALNTGEMTGEMGETLDAGDLGVRVVTDAVDGGTEILLGDPVKFSPDNINEWKSVY